MAARCAAQGEAIPKAVCSPWGTGAGSLTSWSRLAGLAVEVKWVPSVGKTALGSLRLKSMIARQSSGIQEEGQTMSSDRLWQEFFSDPSQWWDNRFDKKNPNSPDFRHKHTKEGLWVEGWSNPSWVKAELAAMIQGQAQCHDVRTLCMAGQLKQALHILNQQVISADSDTYVCLLRECTNMQCLAEGKQVHAHIIRSGLKPNVFLLNTLVNMYAKCGSVVDARQVFDKIPERNMFAWNIMIAGYAKHGCDGEAFEIYEQMKREGVAPNRVTITCVLKACASLAALEKGTEVHVDILKAGIEPDLILNNTLIGMYAKCGSTKDARQVFDNMTERDVVSWNSMVGGYAQHGCGREAFEVYHQMIWDGVTPNRVTFICILKACASLADLEKGKEVHAIIIKSGVEPDTILHNTLIDMYAKCGSTRDARQVFDNMARRDVVSWNTMIAAYAQHGYGMEAFEIYEQMIQERVTPDKVTLVAVLKACASTRAIFQGKEVHDDIIAAAVGIDMILETALVNMYAKCGDMQDARQVFDNMAKRDLVSWSAMIAGYAQNRCDRDALKMYEQMIQEGVTPNKVTFVCILNACAGLGDLEKAKEVHADVMKAGIASYMNLENSLVDMYAKCGSIKDAREVFDSMAERDVVSWSAMIGGYVQHGRGREAFDMYEQMIGDGVKPDKVTFTYVLNACASLTDLEMGKAVHAEIVKADIVQDINFANTLVNMYAKCGSVRDAREAFDKMAERDVVSWSTMIAGYAQHGRDTEALEMYEQMKQEKVTPDKVAIFGVLHVCVHLAALEKGKEVHADMIAAGIVPDINLNNTLVNMYAKCGSIECAQEVFDNMAERDVVSWKAMIAGYAQHGYSREVLQLFEQMQQRGLRPEGAIFICVLSACSHMGLVDEGRQYFESMTRDHNLTPTVDHFGCVVELFGQAGRLEEVEDVINKILIEPNADVWRALLDACRTHDNLTIAESAAQCLCKLDAQKGAT